jgi:hypothetical protein
MEKISVDDLIDLAPPPELMVDRAPPIRWGEVEQRLDTALPEDYKLITTVYGSGILNDLFWLFNPFSQSVSLNLINQIERNTFEFSSHSEEYEDMKAFYPNACPFPSFPEPGGLMPLGGDTNGGYAFWLTEGQADEWPLILYPHGFNEFERHSMRLVEFLVRWLSGRLPDCFFGAGQYFVNRTDPVFQNGAEDFAIT